MPTVDHVESKSSVTVVTNQHNSGKYLPRPQTGNAEAPWSGHMTWYAGQKAIVWSEFIAWYRGLEQAILGRKARGDTSMYLTEMEWVRDRALEWWKANDSAEAG